MKTERVDVIDIKDLRKSYGLIKAVDGLSFKVKKGELFAFLGVNGAGKSTTISVMCGTLAKDGGIVKINGIDTDKNPSAIKKQVGVVFQHSVLDKSLTVRENLVHRASLYGILGENCKKKINYLCSLLDFESFIDRPICKLSGGQRRKIDVARALINDPEILILDEPTTGLDPQTRSIMWKVVDKLRKECGMTVFLTTHYMEEASEADYVVIIDGGKIVAEGSPVQLKNQYTGDFITLYGITELQVQSLNLPFEKLSSGSYRLEVKNTAEATKLIIERPELFSDYEIAKGKMDDVFLTATGKKLTEE